MARSWLAERACAGASKIGTDELTHPRRGLVEEGGLLRGGGCGRPIPWASQALLETVRSMLCASRASHTMTQAARGASTASRALVYKQATSKTAKNQEDEDATTTREGVSCRLERDGAVGQAKL